MKELDLNKSNHVTWLTHPAHPPCSVDHYTSATRHSRGIEGLGSSVGLSACGLEERKGRKRRNGVIFYTVSSTSERERTPFVVPPEITSCVSVSHDHIKVQSTMKTTAWEHLTPRLVNITVIQLHDFR